MRGEDTRLVLVVIAVSGSPPRAWGRQHAIGEQFLRDRFTPTCVGKTNPKCPRHRQFAVHPHVRGEDFPQVAGSRQTVGSPPRAWGRRFKDWRNFVRFRFTPTCVGKTSIPLSPALIASVHPHVRGEDASSAVGLTLVDGSPPRAWGRRCKIQ